MGEENFISNLSIVLAFSSAILGLPLFAQETWRRRFEALYENVMEVADHTILEEFGQHDAIREMKEELDRLLNQRPPSVGTKTGAGIVLLIFVQLLCLVLFFARNLIGDIFEVPFDELLLLISVVLALLAIRSGFGFLRARNYYVEMERRVIDLRARLKMVEATVHRPKS